MSIEVFLFMALLLVALIVLPNAKPPRDVPDEVAPAVVMDLLQGPAPRHDPTMSNLIYEGGRSFQHDDGPVRSAPLGTDAPR